MLNLEDELHHEKLYDKMLLFNWAFKNVNGENLYHQMCVSGIQSSSLTYEIGESMFFPLNPNSFNKFSPTIWRHP